MTSGQDKACHTSVINALSVLLVLGFFLPGLQGKILPNDTEKKELEPIFETHKQTEEPDGIGWSEWGDWSVCSRTCDGGVTSQLRRCVRKSGCKGEAVRFRICNMQPCFEHNDFRLTQCSAFNNVPYRGRLYEWLPFYDPEDVCALTCQAKDFKFVAKLASAVKDGTRCREGSLDMCVDKKCMKVGCDLELGSDKKIDECGVCGGDGSTCRQPDYVWEETHLSPCSVTCGG
ncbi:ADAMTS-like protein 3, partial [Limulus polyphemus]|uniref:ADAMTS-like protein 3 n=1 Tax=Limulus polyphemus TaxID=6850 RepID=A0ABM1S2T9_LIMPO